MKNNIGWFDLSEALTPTLRKGNLDGCIRTVSEAIANHSDSPFHKVLNLSFTNSPVAVANHFDAFIAENEKLFEIKAIYTETNGFDINPWEWYFDLFAYKAYGGHQDYDWLAYMDSTHFEPMVLTGMEELQAVYASKAFRNTEYEPVKGLCSLLVVLMFQSLIAHSAPYMKRLACPLLVTAHDYEFIYEI